MICSFTTFCKTYYVHVIITDLNFEVIYQSTFEIGPYSDYFPQSYNQISYAFPESKNLI